MLQPPPQILLSAKEIKNYHPATNLVKLYTNAAFADVHFIFHSENRILPANRCLLAIASPVFERMFFGDLCETGDIDIVDATADAFAEFLQFFYMDKFELSADNIAEVLTMADKYDVAGLLNLCGIYLEYNLNNETVCWIYELALLFDLPHLRQLCCDRICLETATVLATKSFRQVSVLVLTRILEMDALSCDEYRLYREVMAWAAASCQRNFLPATMENMKSELGACFELIRFPTMSTEEFTQCIAEDGLFDATEYLAILTYLTLRRELKPLRFGKEARNGTPAWTMKDKASICVCDRRSQPNLHRFVDRTADWAVFSVNERVLLGQLSFSTFRVDLAGMAALTTTKEGRLIIRRRTVKDVDIGDDDNDNQQQQQQDETPPPLVITELLSQPINISTVGYTKVLLDKPLIVQPFVEYEIATEWDLDEGEQLVFRTQCRSEVMVDGGFRFQFHQHDNCGYDNIAEGLLARMYFKKW